MGDLAVVTHNVCHLWQGQNRQENERVTQVLLGAVVVVTELSPNEAWVRVETDDTYRGWCERRWLVPAQGPASGALVTQPFAELRTGPDTLAPLRLRLSILSRVSVLGTEGLFSHVQLPAGELGWLATSALAPLPPVPAVEMPVAAAWFASQFLGTPYLWGGSSAFGLDCSGLVQLSYRLAGLVLRRDADIQRSDPRFVPVEKSDLQRGDLVFFGTPERITHVGMHYEDQRFIHSAGGAGVIVTEWGDKRYSPSYVDARRLSPGRALDPVVRHAEERR